jgi:hypothetical protein
MPINGKNSLFLAGSDILDVFSSFEETLRQVAPILLVVPGIVLVLSGLFLWVGGLRFLKPLAVFTAAGAGLACALVFTSRGLVPIVCFTLIPAALALFLDKPVVAALGACVAAAAVLLFPLFTDAGVRDAVSRQVSAVPAAQEMSMLESVEYVEQLAGWAAEWGKAYWAALGDGRKAAAGTLVGVLVIAAVAWRWVCALTCATLGTGMLLTGLFVLVLSKGPQTLPYVVDKMPYFWAAAGGMAAVGTLLNRWLCPVKVKSKPSTKAHVQGDGK